MAWIQFLLGRPGAELTFGINPSAFSVQDGNIVVSQRNIEGDLKKSIIKQCVPSIKLSSTYMTKAERDAFVSLLNIDDTFLSFQTRDDWQILKEKNIATSTTLVSIKNSSITQLDAALIAAGAAGQVTINGVYDNPAGTGTNYFTGGSYAGNTRVITLGTPTVAGTALYVDYTFKGWLVDIESLGYNAEGGWIDRFTYDFQLIGA